MTMLTMQAYEEQAEKHIFDNLNLIGLRKFACPGANKTNEWYLKCVDCEKNGFCGPGKRVLDILNTQTKPEKTQVQKFEERQKKTAAAGKDAIFREAMKHGTDAFQWLADQGYYKTKGSGYAAMKAWAKDSGVSIDQCLTKNGSWNKGKLYRYYADVFFGAPESGDARTAHAIRNMIRLGSNAQAKSACTRLYKTARDYPELNEKYELHALATFMYRYQRTHPKGALLSDMLAEMENGKEETPVKAEAVSDEVSVEDFLKEVKVKPARKADIQPEEPEEPVSGNQEIMRQEFSRKRKQIMDILREQNVVIEKAQSAIRVAEEKLRILDQTAELFGLAVKKKEAV